MSRRAVAVVVLVCAAGSLRLVAFRQLDRTPFLRMDRWAQTDMHYFDQWGRQIAAGDLATATVPLPMHRWHRELAAGYLTQHPDSAARLHGRSDPGEALWADWMHAPRFYQDPLYSYCLAAVYAAGPADPRAAIAVQLVLGVATVVLIATIARRCFGEAAGICAAILALLCAPLLFYELLLLRDSMVAFAGLAIVWLSLGAISNDRRRDVGVLGLAIGIACVLKSTFFLYAAAFAIVFIALRVRQRQPWTGAVTCLAIGLAAGLTPLVARNLVVGAPPLSMASSGPMTFVAANEAQAMPDVGFGINAPVLTAFLGGTNGGWIAAGRAAAAGQTPGHAAGLLWRKWDRAWHWFEIPNNENFYYLRLQAPALAWMPVTFWFCAPLALTGLAFGWRRALAAWPLYLLVATTSASLVAFYVLGRFRVALIAAVIPFAALTLVEIARWIRDGRIVRASAACAAVLVLGAWTGRPLASDQTLIRTADWILAYSIYYQPLAYAALDRKDWDAAATWYLQFFAYEPDDATILASDDRGLAPELADMHQECAQILRLAGRTAEADAQIRVAQRILALR